VGFFLTCAAALHLKFPSLSKGEIGTCSFRSKLLVILVLSSQTFFKTSYLPSL